MSKFLQGLFFVAVLSLLVLITPSASADSWYIGKGLKQGDYFRYVVCWSGWNNCAPIAMTFWVKNQTNDGNWNLQFFVIDGSKSQEGIVTISSITSKAISYSSNLSDYANVYNKTIVWLDSATKNSPKNFSDPKWGDAGFSHCGQTVDSLGQDKATVQDDGTFDAWKIGWYGNPADSMVWVTPNLPFPVKGTIYVPCLGMTGAITDFNFELLQTGNSQTPPPPPPTNQVSIQHVISSVPEFGSLSGMIVAISIIGVMVISRKFRLIHKV